MAKTPKENENYASKEAFERMNKALKKTLDTPPETHDQMVERRQKPARKHSRLKKGR